MGNTAPRKHKKSHKTSIHNEDNRLKEKNEQELIKADDSKIIVSERHDIETINENIGEEWLKDLPQELILEILNYAELPPVTILRCKLLSKYWNGVFKSNNVWKLICKQYGIPSMHFKEDTDYFHLFLSRFAALFIPEKNANDYFERYKGLNGSRLLQTLPTRNIPGKPNVIVAQLNMEIDIEDIVEYGMQQYRRCFKNQRIHRNIAVQTVYEVKKNRKILVFFEVTEDYLTNVLITRPELATEANICDVIKQVISALEWINDINVFTFYLSPENIRVNVLPNNKLQVKIYSALFDLSPPGGFDVPDVVPPEVLLCEQYVEGFHSWLVGWLTFVLLTGRNPFAADTATEHFEAILAVRYSFNEDKDSHVTPSARDFISRLLKRHQGDRMTLKQALQHEWIRSSNKSTEPILNAIEGYKINYGRLRD